jgi:N12 class adenine-specific DNA methylase
MPPNHAPLAVAKQFALLEAAHPGRIDLGIGRAPGSDPVTSSALRGAAGRDDRDIEAFPPIGVSDDLKADYIHRELAALREQRETIETQVSKKRLEVAEKKLTARLEELTDQRGKDTGLRFEQTGCDYLFIEAHLFKNKGRMSNIDELSCPAATLRAEDLAMKLDLLRQRRRDEARATGLPATAVVERVATFATGTPVANSLGEMWVMQQYLRPDLLDAAGVSNINDWGATFTATTSTVEVNATGTALRPVTRVGKFSPRTAGALVGVHRCRHPRRGTLQLPNSLVDNDASSASAPVKK